MNKQITSLLLCFAMVFVMLATAVPAHAAGTVEFKMTADKTEASPGDTITYTVTMGAVSRFDSLKYKLVIPTGLTFVSGSGTLAPNLKTTLNCVDTAWTESTKVFYITMCSEGTGYTSANPTQLMTFQCKVDAGATGNLKVSFDINPNECYDSDYDNIAFSTVLAPVNIVAAPVPATGIGLNKSTLNLTVGENETLIATVEPIDTTDTVTWESSNSGVATVDNTGKVTAVSAGTATITAKAGSKSAICSVTVENAPCTHTNKTPVAEKASNCKDKGWDAYVKCDDCGQLFASDGTTEISAIPFRSLSTTHTGGTATCTQQAVCTVCHQPYGGFAHSYTAATKKAEALKTAGNCRDKAVYYYSCSDCGAVENNDTHTFEGDKDANTHVGGTSTVGASEPDHKNQVDGYTGDTKCLGCNEIIANGTSIPAGAHTPSSTWNSNETHHWKECTTMGCGVIIDGSKAEHSSTGANVATCQHKAVCDVCNVEYGALASHNPASDWTSDATGHWHACQTANCTEKCDFAIHTPDHTGHATEEYAIKCSVCDYVIEAQLAPRTPVTNIAATITAPELGATPDYHPVFTSTPADSVELDEITWYKIAIADFTGTYEDVWDEMETDEAFTTGYYYSVDMYFNPNDGYKLTESTTGTVNGKPHDSTYGNVFDEESSYDGAYLCGLFEPLAAEYTIDLPVSLAVKLTGDEKPGKETFKFEIYDLGCEDAAFEIVNDTVVVENLEFDENGAAFAGGIIKIKVIGEDQLCNLTEGFKVRMVKGTAKGWTYASEQWHVTPIIFEAVTDAAFYIGYDVREIVDGQISETSANGMSFTLGYEAVTEPGPTEPGPTEPGKPADPQSPQTGDSSLIGLWIALLFISGAGLVGTAIDSRKRRSAR